MAEKELEAFLNSNGITMEVNRMNKVIFLKPASAVEKKISKTIREILKIQKQTQSECQSFQIVEDALEYYTIPIRPEIIAELNRKEMKLSFAGAKNSVCLIRNGQLTEIKGDKQTIAARAEQTSEPFIHHELPVKKGDCIYIFSDGYADQFGGEKGKKFKHRQLKDLLISISGKPLHEQKMDLNNNHNRWKGELEQVDDILIIGVRV